jgi:hypothetical protein
MYKRSSNTAVTSAMVVPKRNRMIRMFTH